jgi:two-component system response regulator
MVNPLAGKHILIVEDEVVCRTMLAGFVSSLGATFSEAANGMEALTLLEDVPPDLILCDLAMPEMGGIEFVEHLRLQGNKLPVLVISATERMADVATVLRLGVEDVLLKPLDFSRLRDALLASLYPKLFSSQAIEKNDLIQDWEELCRDPQKAAHLLQQLQPPVQQTLAQCRINYRQLTLSSSPGLVLDIAALSNHDIGFYCLDVSRAGENGVLAALLLRAIFNGLLREHLSSQHLPEMSTLLKQVNQLLKSAHLDGQFPLLFGYYHAQLHNLLLVSAGLHAEVNAGEQQIRLANGVPLGTLNAANANQMSVQSREWQCQVWGAGGRLRLMLAR